MRQGSTGVGPAHEGFADEEGVVAGGAKAEEFFGRGEAALGDADGSGGDGADEREEQLGMNGEVAEVAAVDADGLAVEVQGAGEFFGVVDFAEDVEAVVAGGGAECLEVCVGVGGDDQKDGVGSVSTGFEDLEGVDDEVFPEAGDGDGCGGVFEVCERALEEGLVGEDGEGGGSALREAAGEGGGIEVRANEALRRRGFFEFGEDGGVGLGCGAEGVGKASGLMLGGAAFEKRQVGLGETNGGVVPSAVEDMVEPVGQVLLRQRKTVPLEDTARPFV